MGDCHHDEFLGFKYTIGIIIKTKTVLFASFGLFCLNMVRYGLTDWLSYLLSPEIKGAEFFAIWKSIFYPIGGLLEL